MAMAWHVQYSRDLSMSTKGRERLNTEHMMLVERQCRLTKWMCRAKALQIVSISEHFMQRSCVDSVWYLIGALRMLTIIGWVGAGGAGEGSNAGDSTSS